MLKNKLVNFKLFLCFIFLSLIQPLNLIAQIAVEKEVDCEKKEVVYRYTIHNWFPKSYTGYEYVDCVIEHFFVGDTFEEDSDPQFIFNILLDWGNKNWQKGFVESPEGWHGEVEMLEGEPLFHIYWETLDAVDSREKFGIKRGEELSGFTLHVPFSIFAQQEFPDPFENAKYALMCAQGYEQPIIGITSHSLSVSPPAIGSISPSAGSARGGDLVIITGSDFICPIKVMFGDVPAASFTANSEGQITAVSPPHPLGSVDVRVITPYGISEATENDRFTYDCRPVISTISPNSGPSSGGTSVEIAGWEFKNVSSVTFGGVPAVSFIVESENKIVAISPEYQPGMSATSDVVVTTSCGTSSISEADKFTYTCPSELMKPVVTSISPELGSFCEDAEITIIGENLSSADSVSLVLTEVYDNCPDQIVTEIFSTPKDENSPPFEIISDTEIRAHFPMDEVFCASKWAVKVTNNLCGSNDLGPAYDWLVYYISSVKPNYGPTEGGTTVTINGFGFGGWVSKVKFGDSDAISFETDNYNNYQMTAVSPPHSAGKVHIKVGDEWFESLPTDADLFTFYAPGECSPPPKPLDLTATDAHKNETTGKYQISLGWRHNICSSPLQYQIIYKIPSASSWEFSPLITQEEYQQSGDYINYMWNPPNGCQDYQIMVRSYNPSPDSGVYGEPSEIVVQRSTTENPPTLAWAYVCCGGFPNIGYDTLYWYLSRDDACVVTAFNIRLSPSGPIYATVPAAGGDFYTRKALACPNNSSYYISALIGDREGPYMQATPYCGPIIIGPPIEKKIISTTLTQPNLSLADISGDSLYDIVLQNAYFKANPDGTFTDSSNDLSTTAGNGDIIRVADIDGNRTLDRIIAHKKKIWVELNDGKGHFSVGPSLTLSREVNDLTIAQIPSCWGNSLVALTDKEIVIFSLKNDKWLERERIPLEKKGTALRTGDLNGDGLSDIAAGTSGGIVLYLYSITEKNWIKEEISSGNNIAAIDLADVNGDGFTDIGVGPQGQQGRPFVLLFTPFPNPPLPTIPVPHIWNQLNSDASISVPGIRQIVFIDLDNTGLPGMLIVSEAVDKSVYVKNDGSGKMIPTGFYLKGKVLGVGIGDIDNNGLLDIVAVQNGSVSVYESHYSERELAKQNGNSAPSLVKNIEAKVVNGNILLQWSSAEDDKTPISSLTYQVAVGTANGLEDIISGEIGPGQTSPRKGNALNSTKIVFPIPDKAREIHYAIQAIDSGLKRGGWLLGNLLLSDNGEKADSIAAKKSQFASTNPSVLSITKSDKPFKIIVKGVNFQKGVKVFINGSSIPHQKVGWKSKNLLIIKGNQSLLKILSTTPDTIFEFINPDGGSATYKYKM